MRPHDREKGSPATPSRHDRAAKGRWRRKIAGLVALTAALVAAALSLPRLSRPSDLAPGEDEATFVGTETCRVCHIQAYEQWRGSDHDRAMDVATDATVLGTFDDATFTFRGVTSRFYRRDGKFLVSTEGPDGRTGEFEIRYVFGHDHLQRYLVPFPGGRLQALILAWDVERRRWSRLYPEREIRADDWLHWTRGGQNWNSMCAECHSTDLRKGFDPRSDTYHTTWSEIDVACEACHGRGSRHVAWARRPPAERPRLPQAGLEVPTSGITSRRVVELCAPCHARRAEIGDYVHDGAPLLDFMLPTLLEEHVYHPDGQIQEEDYVYGSFLQSKMYMQGVSCLDCHEPHSLTLRLEGNELCLRCHKREVYDTKSHHFHERIVDGKHSDGARCVKCHMPEQPFMVIDWRADHSIRVPRPDLSAEIGTPKACNGCHVDKPVQWAVDACRRWYGQARKPHFGMTFKAARDGDPAAWPGLQQIAGSELYSPIVRATAIELLAQAPYAEAALVLRSATDSPDGLVRATAAAQLPLYGDEDVQRLCALLRDPLKAVRLAAVPRAAVVLDRLDPERRRAFDVALAEYRAAMTYELDFPSSHFNLGNLAYALGNAEGAEREYRAALAIDDRFLPARANLAVVLSSLKRHDEAEAMLRAILREHPKDPGTLYSLGLLLVEVGRQDEGLAALGGAAEGRPYDARARYNLGLLLQSMGRMDEAWRPLSRALEIEPRNLDYLRACAEHLLLRGRKDEARQLVERMLALRSDLPAARRLMAAIDGGR